MLYSMPFQNLEIDSILSQDHPPCSNSFYNRAILEKNTSDSFCVDRRGLPPTDVLDKAQKWPFKTLASCPG